MATAGKIENVSKSKAFLRKKAPKPHPPIKETRLHPESLAFVFATDEH